MRDSSQAERESTDFRRVLAALCHRAKQPITALRGMLEVSLLDKALEATCRETLEQLLQQSDRLVGIIRLLSEVIESAEPGSASEPIIWRELVEEAWTELKPQAEQTGVRMVFKKSSRRQVNANAERLYEATRRGLEYALKRCSKTGILEISLAISGQFLRLTICDEGSTTPPNGCGFDFSHSPPEALSALDIERWIISQIVRTQRGRTLWKARSPQGSCLCLEMPLLPLRRHRRAVVSPETVKGS